MVLIIMSAFASLKQGLEKGDEIGWSFIQKIKKSPERVINSTAYGVGVVIGTITGSASHFVPRKAPVDKNPPPKIPEELVEEFGGA